MGFSTVAGLTVNPTQLSQSARRVLPLVFRHRAQEPLEVAFTEVAPVGMLALAYLFEKGRAFTKGTQGGEVNWVKALLEGGATSLLVQNTKNIYPMVAMGWAAYQAGTAQTQKERIQALINAGVLFPLGYAGVHAGMWMNDGLYLRDAAKVLEQMPAVQQLMNPAASPLSPTMRKRLKPSLDKLQRSANSLYHMFRNPHLKAEQLKKLTQTFNQSMADVTERLDKVSPGMLKRWGGPAQHALKRLRGAMETSRYYTGLRMLNPWFGYLLAVTFVGIPLTGLVGKALFPADETQTQGQSHGESRDKFVAPLWMHKIIPSRSAHGAIGGHGADPYSEADGPGLIALAHSGNAL